MDIQKPSLFDRLFGAESACHHQKRQHRFLHMVWGKHRRGRVVVNPDIFWDSDSDDDDDDDDDDGEDVPRDNKKGYHSSSSSSSSSSKRSKATSEKDHEYANRVYAATVNKLQSPPPDLRVNVALWCILGKSSASKQREKMLPPLLADNPTGKRKVACRYFLMLLETPVHQIRQNRHPIHEAVDRRRRRFADATIVTTAQPQTMVKKAKSFPTYWKRQREPRCATATVAEEMKERRMKLLHKGAKDVHSSSAIHRPEQTEDDDQDDVPLGLLKKPSVETFSNQ
ncbi:hypothetical protein BJV82DRAFT_588116 [Fennellomyces sp. T-0311]|nr:hypothetical protein BJV82DRAFT_588116 [Fennellomyces sp. T-0311]